jgi:hypothetical protein
MKLISYKVTHDTGFAPNPYFGILTLATCKPAIRRSQNVTCGDWLVGWTAASSKNNSTPVGKEKLVYLSRITEIIPIKQYWFDYPQKRPDIYKGKNSPYFYGDNIYEPDDSALSGFNMVCNIFHSEESKHKKHDLSGKNVIVCKEFYYFGAKNALEIPENVKNGFNNVQRGHTFFYEDEKIENFISFVRNNKNECKFMNT